MSTGGTLPTDESFFWKSGDVPDGSWGFDAFVFEQDPSDNLSSRKSVSLITKTRVVLLVLEFKASRAGMSCICWQITDTAEDATHINYHQKTEWETHLYALISLHWLYLRQLNREVVVWGIAGTGHQISAFKYSAPPEDHFQPSAEKLWEHAIINKGTLTEVEKDLKDLREKIIKEKEYWNDDV